MVSLVSNTFVNNGPRSRDPRTVHSIMSGDNAGSRWNLRTVPPELVERYTAEGWWTDETLGATVAGAVGRLADAELVVHSKVRPWRGTFGEVDRAARSFAASLQARGVGPGDVVVFQLPNWVEAAITFWGAAQLGAVVVPIVHFYGPKEVGYVLDVVQPDVVVTAARFGQTDYLATYDVVAPPTRTDTPWFVVGAERRDASRSRPPLRRAARRRADRRPRCRPTPTRRPSSGSRRARPANPKGVIHSHRTLGFEVRQLGAHVPASDRPPTLTGAPVGHFIGMLNAFLLPLLQDQAIHLLDVWDPGEVLRIMQAEDIGLGGGADLLPHQPARPPGLHRRSTSR